MLRSESAPDHRSSVLHRLSNRPMAAVALAFSLGIALAGLCLSYLFSGIAAGGLCLIAASLLALLRGRAALSLTLALASTMVSGLLLGLAVRDGFPSSDLRYHLSHGSLPMNEPVLSEGCIVQESEMRGAESVAVLEFHAFRRKDRWVYANGQAMLRLPGADPDDPPGKEFRLMRGDRIRAWATWNIPRNYRNPGSADNAGRLARRGVFLVGKIKSLRLLDTIPGGCADPWTGLANTIATRVRKSLEPLRTRETRQKEAVLASLVIGDYSLLNTPTREAFQNSGTFHVLVISGLHVAWIAGLFLQILKMARVPERMAYLLAFMVILLYTCVVGFQASITRCLWMFLLYLIGRMVFRQGDAVNILLASALILLAARPNWLFEAGFQLSFISVLAIALTAVPVLNRCMLPVGRPLLYLGASNHLFLKPGRYHRLGRALRVRVEMLAEGISDRLSPAVARVLLLLSRGCAAVAIAIGSLIVTSLSVQVWLQPLLACYFNRVSWISPLANPLIVPLSSLVLGTGIAGVFTAGLPAVGSATMHLAGWLASLLLDCAARITALPGAWQRCPTPPPWWVLTGVILLLLWSLLEWRRFWIPCAGIAAMLAYLSLGSVAGLLPESARWAFHQSEADHWKGESSVLSFTFLDVGEGDSIVIRLPDGRFWVLDGGGIRQSPSQEEGLHGLDIGESIVSRYLWHFWVTRLDRLLLSHPDLDHAGGIPALLKNFRVARLEYARSGSDKEISGILNVARERKIPTRILNAGMQERVGPVAVRVLNPPTGTLFSSTNENSLVLEFSFRRFSALLTGDLEKAGEAAVLSMPLMARSLLLKVAHHGSRHGTSDALLDRTRPRWAVLSVGLGNPFGHPATETLARILSHRARPVSTAEEGAITFETDGYRYILKSHLSGLLEDGEL